MPPDDSGRLREASSGGRRQDLGVVGDGCLRRYTGQGYADLGRAALRAESGAVFDCRSALITGVLHRVSRYPRLATEARNVAPASRRRGVGAKLDLTAESLALRAIARLRAGGTPALRLDRVFAVGAHIDQGEIRPFVLRLDRDHVLIVLRAYL